MPTQRMDMAPVPATDPDAELSRATCPAPDEMLASLPSSDPEGPGAEEQAAKTTRDENEAPARDIPSPVSVEDAAGDCSLSQSISSPDPLAELQRNYSNDDLLGDPFPRTRFRPNTSSSFLKPGAKFVGTQKSEKSKYEVSVELQHVDMEESFLCGYLRIQGLTEEHQSLTTYFEGEMIGTKHTFITKHPEWGSSEKVDLQHWGRFPAWRPYGGSAKRHNHTVKNFAQRENIFMRWKEYFLVPDHRVRNITGASFEGFYYICFNQMTGTITGIYFHAKTEK